MLGSIGIRTESIVGLGFASKKKSVAIVAYKCENPEPTSKTTRSAKGLRRLLAVLKRAPRPDMNQTAA